MCKICQGNLLETQCPEFSLEDFHRGSHKFQPPRGKAGVQPKLHGLYKQLKYSEPIFFNDGGNCYQTECVLLQIHPLKPNAQLMVFGAQAFEKCLGHEGRALISGTSVSVKVVQERFLVPREDTHLGSS